MKRSRAASALAVGVLVVLPTAGCYQGFEGTVNSQGATGNGTDLTVGDVLVQNVVLVSEPSGAGGVAALSMSLINDGELPEALLEVSTEPASRSSQSSPIALRSGQKVQVGGESNDQIILTGVPADPGSYATVTFSFERSGSETRQIAVVPAEGYYEGYAPAAAVEEAVTEEP